MFGGFYFLQGICEPTEGLIAQPVRFILKSWGETAAEMSTFAALLALPWSLKPLYGLITDFVPLAGYRRKSYVVLASALAALGLGGLALLNLQPGSHALLFALLILPTTCVAFSDVVVDALMVERGQPLGLTGRLQSVQWTCMWAAAIFTGYAGGWLSTEGRQHLGFAIAAAAVSMTLLLAVMTSEPHREAPHTVAGAARELRQAARIPAIWAVAAFIFLWSFNPFQTSVLYIHMTQALGFGESFYGETVSLSAAGSLIGSLLYGTYCRRFRMTTLIHLSIVMGVLTTAAYAAMYDRTSARVVTVAVGFAYATATMVQFDLAAQVCPPLVAGTLFALLMSVSNLAVSLSTWLGGTWYTAWSRTIRAQNAFEILVFIGSAMTACCWLLVPVLTRSLRKYPAHPE